MVSNKSRSRSKKCFGRQELLRERVVQLYCRNVHAAVFVDETNMSSFCSLSSWIEEGKHHLHSQPTLLTPPSRAYLRITPTSIHARSRLTQAPHVYALEHSNGPQLVSPPSQDKLVLWRQLDILHFSIQSTATNLQGISGYGSSLGEMAF